MRDTDIAHAALRQRFHIIIPTLTSFGYALDEATVKHLNLALHFFTFVRCQRFILGIDRSEMPAREQFFLEADLLIESTQVHFAEEHADRTGERVGVGQYGISGHGDKVSARSRQIGHRNQHRLLLAQRLHLVQDVVGSDPIAAG